MKVVARELIAVAGEIVAADANMAYDAKMRELRQKVHLIDKQLYRHEARQGGRPADWSFVEALQRASNKLDEMMRELGS